MARGGASRLAEPGPLGEAPADGRRLRPAALRLQAPYFLGERLDGHLFRTALVRDVRIELRDLGDDIGAGGVGQATRRRHSSPRMRSMSRIP